jgi:hypothetical protein
MLTGMAAETIVGVISIFVCCYLCFLQLQARWRSRDRQRMVSLIRAVSISEHNEIGGHSLEHWLSIINTDAAYPVSADETMLFTFRGIELFFIGGAISYIPYGKGSGSGKQKACFLVAVGRSAVAFLSDQERVFRHIAGSPDVAVFSIFSWSAFAEMLAEDR